MGVTLLSVFSLGLPRWSGKREISSEQGSSTSGLSEIRAEKAPDPTEDPRLNAEFRSLSQQEGRYRERGLRLRPSAPTHSRVATRARVSSPRPRSVPRNSDMTRRASHGRSRE